MAYDSLRHKIVLYGGYVGDQTDNPETWEWDGVSWKLVSTKGPGARCQMAMAYDELRKKMFMFGGYSWSAARGVDGAESGVKGDTWSWDGTKWSMVSKSGPTKRFGHAMAYFGMHQKVMLYGGWFFSDAWEFGGKKWQQIEGADYLDRTSMAYDPIRQRMVVFSGFTSGGGSTRTLEYDGQDWTVASQGGPPERIDAAMAYDVNLKQVVVFGGHDWVGDDLRYYGDTWGWNGTTWKRLSTKGPKARTQLVMATDTYRKKVVLFGGEYKGTYYGDTWEWDGRAWTKMIPK